MNLFYGYPQHKDAHPERPWWRAEKTADRGVEWVRADGVRMRQVLPRWFGDTTDPLPYGGWSCGWAYAEKAEDVMAKVDNDPPHAMPPPTPLVGQVWRLADRFTAITELPLEEAAWPPNGVLVYGPSQYGPDVPWAPPGWKP